MAGKSTVVGGETISYTGYFSLKDLVASAKTFMKSKGGFSWEPETMEIVHESGKEIYHKIRTARKLSDYVKGQFTIEFSVKNLVKKDIMKDNRKKKMDHGDVTVTITAELQSDYDNTWEQQPVYTFIRGIYNKFIFSHYIDEAAGVIKGDAMHLKEKLKAELNLNHY